MATEASELSVFIEVTVANATRMRNARLMVKHLAHLPFCGRSPDILSMALK